MRFDCMRKAPSHPSCGVIVRTLLQWKKGRTAVENCNDRVFGENDFMNEDIIDRGRGPEIKGTRTTVFHVMDYYKLGWHHSSIALVLNLSSRQVLAAIRYIEEHREEV